MKELVIATGFDIRSGNVLYDEVPCGEIFDTTPPSIEGLRTCGEFGYYCPKCSQASSKANNHSPSISEGDVKGNTLKHHSLGSLEDQE